jgi:hypothetical protein
VALVVRLVRDGMVEVLQELLNETRNNPLVNDHPRYRLGKWEVGSKIELGVDLVSSSARDLPDIFALKSHESPPQGFITQIPYSPGRQYR